MDRSEGYPSQNIEVERETKVVQLRHGLSAIYIYKTPEEILSEQLGATIINEEQ